MSDDQRHTKLHAEIAATLRAKVSVLAQGRLKAVARVLDGEVPDCVVASSDVSLATLDSWVEKAKASGAASLAPRFDGKRRHVGLDLDGAKLRTCAAATRSRRLAARCLALAAVADGKSIDDASVEVGATATGVRAWLRRFHQGGIEALRPIIWDGAVNGRDPYELDPAQESGEAPKKFGPLTPREEQMLALLGQRGWMRRMELLDEQIPETVLRRLLDRGMVVLLQPGLYSLAEASRHPHFLLAEAAKRVLRGVIALASAAYFHGLLDEAPPQVVMALASGDTHHPVQLPPVQFVFFRRLFYEAGIEEHTIESTPVRIYDPAKTVVDLFRYSSTADRRYKRALGTEAAVAALETALREGKATGEQLRAYARALKIENVISRYL